MSLAATHSLNVSPNFEINNMIRVNQTQTDVKLNPLHGPFVLLWKVSA